MAEKDISEKILESYNDVFADIVNVLLFNGEEVIKPDELVDATPRSAYKADGKIREIERDVAKRWEKQNIRIACIGFENQTAEDADMPLRIIGYDGAEYRAQLNSGSKERYPVVTLTLYFGYERPWSKPKNLLGSISVPEKFKPFVNDYKVNLFEIAYLTDEQVKMFKSDFGIVAEYFVKMRKGKGDEYADMKKQFVHVQETLQLLSVMTKDHEFEDLINDSKEGAPNNMCEALEKIKSIGRAEGIAEGMAKGEAKGEAKGMNNLALLMSKLFQLGRTSDAEKAANDSAYRDKLLKEFGISDS